MDNPINCQINNYLQQFKESVINKMKELAFSEKDKLNEILEYVNEYEKLVIKKDELVNKKRNKNTIPQNYRCNAKRANGEQCTRKRKDGYEFCGTHTKGIPNGSVQVDPANQNMRKLEVVVQDINGIAYYLDQENNIYRTEDIISNKENPQVVAKYRIADDGVYHIEKFVV
jgi:hypothetical protein